jgi:tRNA G18 (ribose-2'-O)-methylase SpoU
MSEERKTMRERDLKASGLILLEGSFLVERGIAEGLVLEEAFCVPQAQARWLKALNGACPLRVLPEPELTAILGYPFHRGAFALARRPQLPEAFLSKDGSKILPTGDILCLWQVTDPDNLGALLRSGAALGAVAAVIGPGCADPFYPKALRSSMGAALSIPLFSIGAGGLDELCAAPRIGAAAALGGEPLRGSGSRQAIKEARRGGGISLFMGNEGWGLPDEVLEACRIKIEIPMSGKTDSLNVAAAGAILMWELFGMGAQRASGEPPHDKERREM